MQAIKCDYSEKVPQYAANSLPDREAEDFESHLHTCSDCCRTLATLMESGNEPQWLAIYRDGLRDHAEILEAKRDRTSADDSQQEVVVADTSEKSPGLPEERYRFVRRIGEGGMGSVWEGWDGVMRRRVALKRLHSSLKGVKYQQRLLQEASSLARLSHPQIVSIYEILFRDDQPALVMEYVDGPSLAKWRQGKIIGERQAARLIEQLALALVHAHQCGVIHRDLKPANILLQFPRGSGLSMQDLDRATAKLTDFGIARLVDGQQVTHTGDLLGTPAYMAPEQTRSDSSDAGCATDVYGLGAVLYELLTGAPPHLAQDPIATLALVREHEPVPPRSLRPELSRDIETICLKSMSKRIEDRYASASDMAADLNRFLAGRPIIARPLGPLGIALRFGRRNKLLAATLGLAVFCMFSLILGSVYFARAERTLRFDSDQATRRAVQAEAEAKTQAIRAEQALDTVQGNFRIAIESITEYLTTIHQTQPNNTTMHPAERRLMEQSMALYKTFLQTLPEPEAWDLEEAVAVIRYVELALMYDIEDDLDRWLTKFESNRDRIQQESLERPERSWPTMIYYQVMGHRANKAGKLTELIDWRKRYGSLMEQLSDKIPDDLYFRREASHAWMNAAASSEEAGLKEEAIANAAKSVSLYRKLLHEVGDSEIDRVVFIEKLLWQGKMSLLNQDHELLTAIEKEVNSLLSQFPANSSHTERLSISREKLKFLKNSMTKPTSDLTEVTD